MKISILFLSFVILSLFIVNCTTEEYDKKISIKNMDFDFSKFYNKKAEMFLSNIKENYISESGPYEDDSWKPVCWDFRYPDNIFVFVKIYPIDTVNNNYQSLKDMTLSDYLQHKLRHIRIVQLKDGETITIFWKYNERFRKRFDINIQPEATNIIHKKAVIFNKQWRMR